MPKVKNPPLTTPSRVKDTTPELDDIQSIKLDSIENPTAYDVGLIEGMASHYYTSKEICAIIRMSKGRFEKHLVFQAAYERGLLLGNANLRRMMFVGAKTQPVLQIWLSKQHLGMTDRPEPVQGESQQDAYKGFLDKLNIVINVQSTGSPGPIVVGAGKGDSEVLLETVGTTSPACPESQRVVAETLDEKVDRGVAPKRKESGEEFHRLLEDMVISGRSG